MTGVETLFGPVRAAARRIPVFMAAGLFAVIGVFAGTSPAVAPGDASPEKLTAHNPNATGGYVLTYEVLPGGKANVEEAIRVLKKRVDPEGTLNTEWAATADNRFELRIPPGDPASARQKEELEAALAGLKTGNLLLSQVASVEDASATDRPKVIAALVNGVAKGDAAAAADWTKKLEAAAELHDKADQLRKNVESLQAKANVDLKELAAVERTAYAAMKAHRAARDRVVAKDVEPTQLEPVLQLYVSPREKKALEDSGNETRAKTRMGAYNRKLDAMRMDNSARQAEIDRVQKLYEAWADGRGPLGDADTVKRLIARSGVLEFRIAPLLPVEMAGPNSSGPNLTRKEYEQYVKDPRQDNTDKENPDRDFKYWIGTVVEDPQAVNDRSGSYKWFPLYGEAKEFSHSCVLGEWAGMPYVLLCNTPDDVMLQEPGEKPWKVDDAHLTSDQFGRPIVDFKMDKTGGDLMAGLTSRHKGHMMAILLDDEAFTAPIIQAVISGSGVIEGSFTDKERSELLRTLQTGSLPWRIKFIGQEYLGPPTPSTGSGPGTQPAATRP